MATWPLEAHTPPAHAIVREPFAKRRVALVLNHRARGVTGALADALSAEVGAHHVYASHTMVQARHLSALLVQRGYDTVVCAGGDGTLIGAVNHILRHSRPGRGRRLPAFAFLALGTGNALRHTVRGSDPVADLRRLMRGEVRHTLQVPLIEGPDGDHFLFGGLGYDAMLLSDYTWLCEQVTRGPARPLVRSLGGYIAALCTRTLPRLYRRPLPLRARVTLRTGGLYIDPTRGDHAVPVPAGTQVYDGPLGLLGFGTTPFFGYGLRVFPFAGLWPDKMQLRLVTLGPVQTLAHLGALWRGTYRNAAQVRDYAVDDVEIALAVPQPYQHSGEDRGDVQALRLRIAAEPLRLVDLAG